MKRIDKHIDKFLRDPLPEPEIRADDAWTSMSDMLDAIANDEANRVKAPAHFWKSIGKLRGLLIAISAVVTVSAVIALVVLNAETKTQKSTESQSIKSSIEDSAAVKTKLERNISKSETEQVDIAASSPSEKHPPATPSPEITSSKTTSARSSAGAASQVISDVSTGKPAISKSGRIENKSSHLLSHPAGSSRIHTGTTSATRPQETRVSAGAHEKEHNALPGRTTIESGNKPGAFSGRVTRESENDTFPDRVTRQNNAASQANSSKSGQAPQETVPSFSYEKNTPAVPAQMSLNNLAPLAGHFKSMDSDLSKLVQKPALPNAPQPPAQSRNPVWKDIHFGPEWNITRSFVAPNYMFTGADSTKHPLRLAIPGVFVSKSWNRHTATFIFNPLHSYFGDKERVAQRVDTIPSADSTLRQVKRNTNFIKAFGLNFSLQYQYHVVRGLSLVGGLSYARYSSALLRKETDYTNGTIVDEAYLTARGQGALKSYMNPQQWNIRAGILFYSRGILNNRLQVAWMTIIPVSNLSLTGFKKVNSPNIQLSLRFLVK
ncbi:hypothetical protein J2Y45_005458 [Dyadobacter sp. BE34]|uniref:Outer membrane protein beta-barrel domain-containing protein n=1 Tax=Dyadobacter fermentans TaxID=94254 RepID=A0ABU1R4B8_9BACT|nr:MULTISPECIES: hypothetical protein [Dyadobacter]MDR6808193.1 hypothetical protein [Dyadobacter fermentans]MDR7045991.1 hypothetical protein [Dyadobacter sp. BE242]MDR7200304.1 hypothetical protein [Dyadobacter sp. BE34]MDR7218264.1 hypothetical protein [Dyadobacter sp. BE31]MDR7266195.1 hypothetical protein [Dyadobacter sp. BE32]